MAFKWPDKVVKGLSPPFMDFYSYFSPNGWQVTCRAMFKHKNKNVMGCPYYAEMSTTPIAGLNETRVVISSIK